MSTEQLQFLSLYELVESHLDPLKMTEELQEQILQSFLFICRDRGFVNDSSGETFYTIPYQEITECIYAHNFEISDELNSVIEGLIEPLKKVLEIDGLSPEELKEYQNKNSVHELNAYKRFVSHIQLAVCQRKYIADQTLDVVLQLNDLKQENKALTNNMRKSLALISDLTAKTLLLGNELDQAKKLLSDSREIIVESVSKARLASEQANRAQATVGDVQDGLVILQNKTDDALKKAQKAQKDAEDSKTQFVTILGIFASIIVALFGGMSLIRATVELLQNSSNLLVLVFVTSILLLSFSLLIILLTSWISSLKSEQESKHYYVLRWMTLFILTIVAIVCGTLVHDNPTDKSETRKPNFELEIKTKGSS